MIVFFWFNSGRSPRIIRVYRACNNNEGKPPELDLKKEQEMEDLLEILFKRIIIL